MRSLFSILALVVAASLVPRGRLAPSSRLAAHQSFQTGTTAVVVDVIVRDKRGAPVADLRKDDFELFEDGVRQNVADCSFVSPGSNAPGDGPLAATSAVADKYGRSFVALVFDHLSPEAQALARKGALAYFDTAHQNDFVGVFAIDQAMTIVQDYTNDPVSIRNAIDKVGRGATTKTYTAGASSDPQSAVRLRSRSDSMAFFAVSKSDLTRRGTAGDGPDDVASIAAQSHSTWQQLERTYQGYATTDALIAIVSSLGTLPGRKTVVFFAEGLSIPDAVLPHFRDIVATANASNVSIYAIDATGLRVRSAESEAAEQLHAAGAAQLTVLPDGSTMSSLGMLERNEDVLRRSPRSSLGFLSDATGGFLMDQSNDLAAAFRNIDADRHAYYLLTYVPTNTEFSGEWRRIQVTVPRKDVRIRSRSGYLAVHTAGPTPLFGWEAPALAALEQGSGADLPLRAATFVFPSATQPMIAVFAAVDGHAIKFSVDKTAQTYSAELSIVARVRDGTGSVIGKASQPYSSAGPLSGLLRAADSDIYFVRYAHLSPGPYSVEIAAYDALAHRTGVQRLREDVPRVTQFALGTLMLAGRSQSASSASANTAENPLRFGDL